MLYTALSCVAFQIVLVYLANGYGNKVSRRSCLDHLRSGANVNGIYLVVGQNDVIFIVYCDFVSEPNSAWTLVMSWSLQNGNRSPFKSSPLAEDSPVQETRPNWAAYRLSKESMVYIKSKSSHWRSTCNFEKDGIDYRDYVRGNFTEFDVISFHGDGQCKKVEQIGIRGHAASQTTVGFWQSENTAYLLHTDSSYKGCKFDATEGAVPGENNFGYYATINNLFRCTADQVATTQYWFGGFK